MTAEHGAHQQPDFHSLLATRAAQRLVNEVRRQSEHAARERYGQGPARAIRWERELRQHTQGEAITARGIPGLTEQRAGDFLLAGIRGVIVARRNSDAFVRGLWLGLTDSLTAAQLAELAGKSYLSAYLLAGPLSPVLVAGAVQGTIESIDSAVEQIRHLIDNWDEFLEDIVESIQALLSEAGEAVFLSLGREIGAQQAAEIAQLLERPFHEFVWELSKLIGPVVLGIVLSYVTGGLAGALGVSARLGVAALRRIPRLAGIARKWHAAFRLRRAGGHSVVVRPRRQGRPRRPRSRFPLGGSFVLSAEEEQLLGQVLGVTFGASSRNRTARMILERLKRHWDEAWHTRRSGRQLAEFEEARSLPTGLRERRVRDLFDAHRDRFITQIGRDPELQGWLRAAGIRFQAGRMPFLRYRAPDGSLHDVLLNVDHVDRLVDNPSAALLSRNLRLITARENSAVLEAIRSRDPFWRAAHAQSREMIELLLSEAAGN